MSDPTSREYNRFLDSSGWEQPIIPRKGRRNILFEKEVEDGRDSS
jgi:hypothetical protein